MVLPKPALLMVCLAGLMFAATAQAADVIELPRMTMSEMAREPVPFVSAHQAREHERAEMHRFASTFSAGTTPISTAISNIVPPHIALTFRDTFDPPRAYPADAAGAVGPHHLLGVTNVSVTVHDRSGAPLSSVFEEQFWSDTTGAIFDPRAAYDAASDRFVVTAIIDTNLVNAYFLVAVSATGDPTGAWRRFKIPTTAGNNQSYDLDYTRLAITSATIVASARFFISDNFSGTTAILISKSDAYSANNSVNATRVVIGDTVDEYTPVDSDDAVTRFVSTNPFGATALRVWEVSGTSLVNKETHAPTLSPAVTTSVGSQLGTSFIVDISQTDFTCAFLRGGTLYALQEVLGSALLWRDTATQQVSMTLIADPKGQVAYAFPSMAIARDGSALVAYAIFDPTAYIASGYSYVDRFGNVSASTTIHNSEGPYKHDRWGDFSTTAIDPVDQTSFWTTQIYSMQHPTSPTQYVWATTWSHITYGGSRARGVRH